MKRCGLVIRVSTDDQARNPEGSLKTQLERLRAHITYKNELDGEWTEAEIYTLEAISGKDSVRSRQFAQLADDIRTGKINTVICTALDRLSRSVKDFLEFFEFLTENDVEFVCLKQNFDTTSAHGRLFIIFTMALAQFEREQTSERNRDASRARAERGLWNGGQVLGYDLDPNKKGTLIPNEREAAVVNFGFDTYLETGSIYETVKRLNERGYRTKEYMSRREKFHPAKKFHWTPVRWMLLNYTYIGKKEVNKKKQPQDQSKLPEAQRYRLVDGNWPGIVDEEKFYAVRRLLEANGRTKTNQIKGIRHCYLFNGILWCECGQQMEGRSGTSRLRKRYYYYVCKECRLRLPAEKIEGVVLDRIRELATDGDLLTQLVAETNKRLRSDLPRLLSQQQAMVEDVTKLEAEAEGLLGKLSRVEGETETMVIERLDKISERRKEIQASLSGLDKGIDDVRREAVNETEIREALSKTTEVFHSLPPYHRKKLIRLVLERAEASESRLRLAFRGRPANPDVLNGKNGDSRSETPKWLLG